MAKTYKYGFVIEGDATKGTKTVKRFREEVEGVQRETGKARQGTKQWRDETDKNNKSLLTARNAIVGVTGALAAMGVTRFAQGVIQDYREFEVGLLGVSKTTGLVGEELDRYSDRIDKLSRGLPVTTAELLELSQAAGQMGVSGAANLERFSVTIAKLGRASDLAGEEGAKSLARILNVTGEAVDSIDVLASVIVSLGNNVAATESEIARSTTEVARATSQFDISAASAAAMAAAMASLGIQAEVGGSSVGRVLQEITLRVQAGGKELESFAQTIGLNADELTRLFNEDKTLALEYFLEAVGRKGLDAGGALKEVGLGGQQVMKTIIPLANNIDVLRRTMALANAEVENATALDQEFETTLASLDAQWLISQNQISSYRRLLGNELLPTVTDALAAFNAWGEEDGPEKMLAATGTGVQLLGVAITAKLLGPLLASSVRFAGAAASAALYTASLHSVHRGLAIATLRQSAMNAALTRGKAALSLLGGAGGVLLLTVGALYTFREELGLVHQSADDAMAALDGLADSVDGLTAAQAANARLNLQINYDKQTEKLAALKSELVAYENLVATGTSSRTITENMVRVAAEIDTTRQVLERYDARLHEMDFVGPMQAAVEVTSDLAAETEILGETTDELTNKIDAQILSLRQRVAASQLDARNQAIYNALMSAGSEVTSEQVDQIVALTGALYDNEAAQRAANDSTKAAEQALEDMARESERVAKALQEDWAETRREFGEFFADMVQDGDNAFDALLKSFERMLLEMSGQLALSGLAKMFGINVPGAGTGGIQGVLDSSGFAGDVTGALINKFGGQFGVNSGLSDIAAGLGFGDAVQAGADWSTGAPVATQNGFNSAQLLDGLKTMGLNIGAGIAGGWAGNEVGEALFGKVAESNIGQSIGTAIGTAVGGPLGALIGSSLGSMVDVMSGGDGKVRQNAGFFVAPTAGANSDMTFGAEAFESGLQIQGFARRADQAAAQQVIEQFRSVDAVVSALVRELGGTLDLTKATLNGLDEEATPGSAGTFMGLGGNGQLAGDIMSQINMFVDQLADHASGLDQELLDAIRSAGNAEAAISLLSTAVIEQAAASEEAAALADRAKATAEKLAKAERDLLMGRIDAASQMTSELAAIRSLRDSMSMDVYKAMGAAPLFNIDATVTQQIQHIEEQRQLLIRNHEQQISAERRLHESRMQSARSLSDYADSLRLGDMSPLSGQEQYNLAQQRWESTLQAALSGDLDAAGRLQQMAESYATESQYMFASSEQHRNTMQEILAGLDQVAGIVAPDGEYDPSAANQALIDELQGLDHQLAQIAIGVNNSIIAELQNINVTLSELAPDMQNSLVGAISQWVEQSTPDGDGIITALSGIRAGIDVLPPEIAHYLSSTMQAFLRATGNQQRTTESLAPGSIAQDAARQALIDQGYNLDYSADDISEYVNQQGLGSGNFDQEVAAIRRIYEEAVARGIGSAQLADVQGYTQQGIYDALIAAGIDPTGFATGGIASGPTSGHLEMLHGTEAVIPLPDGRSVPVTMTGAANDNRELVQEVRALRESMGELVRISLTAGELSTRQRNRMTEVLQSIDNKQARDSVGSARYVKSA